MSAPPVTRRDAVVFFAAAALLFTANLGGTSLAPLDDCFYARKAAEMAAHPGMTVTWAGRPAFQNPPGQLWLMAASLRAFGENDFAARLPAALMSLGVLAGTAWIGARLLSPAAGLAGAALLMGAPIFLNNSRRAMLDTPALFWTVAALAALVASRRRPGMALLFAPALAMAMLTKSVLGLAPLLVALAAAALLREWRPLLRDPRFLAATALGLALGSIWWLHQWRAHGAGFLEVHFVREIAARSSEPVGAARRLLGYPAILLSQFQPLVLLAIPGAWHVTRDARGAAPASRLLLAWALVPLAVALASSAQSSRYVFAILPALALLSAAWLDARWPRATRGFAARVAPALALAGAALLWARPDALTRDRQRPYRDAAPALAARVPAGREVAFLGDDYWRIANPLLWYDGLRLAPSAASAADAITDARARDGLLMVGRSRWEELPPGAREGRRWIETADAVLLELRAGP